MNAETPASDAAEPDRDELERDLLEWFKTQEYSPAEIDRVLEKMRQFDDRTLQESFFASVGTGSIELSDLIDTLLGEKNEERSELDFVISRWPGLDPATQKAMTVLARGNLPRSTHQAVIALIESLPPTG